MNQFCGVIDAATDTTVLYYLMARLKKEKKRRVAINQYDLRITRIFRLDLPASFQGKSLAWMTEENSFTDQKTSQNYMEEGLHSKEISVLKRRI